MTRAVDTAAVEDEPITHAVSVRVRKVFLFSDGGEVARCLQVCHDTREVRGIQMEEATDEERDRGYLKCARYSWIAIYRFWIPCKVTVASGLEEVERLSCDKNFISKIMLNMIGGRNDWH